MASLFRKTFSHPAIALASTLLWGIIELVALQRFHWLGRNRG